MMRQCKAVFLLMVLAAVLFGCTEEQLPQENPVPKAVSTSQTEAKPGATGGAPPAQVALWPPPADKNEYVEIATDLMVKNYYVVLDGSGSMADRDCSGAKSKSTVLKEALVEFARSVPADANLGLLVFDSRGVTERVPLGVGAANRDAFIAEVNDARADSGTPLYDAIVRGYKKLIAQGRRQLAYGEYHLVVGTDGHANTGQDPTAAVDHIVTRSPVVIHTVGFCIGNKHALNQPGRTIYKEANNPDDVRRGLQDVLAEALQFDVSDFNQ